MYAMKLSPIGISLLAWNMNEIWMAIGVVIFVYFARKSSKRGISIIDIFGEVLPP